MHYANELKFTQHAENDNYTEGSLRCAPLPHGRHYSKKILKVFHLFPTTAIT